jgi:hypothetical protein
MRSGIQRSPTTLTAQLLEPHLCHKQLLAIPRQHLETTPERSQSLEESYLAGTPEQMEWELHIQSVKQDLAFPEM